MTSSNFHEIEEDDGISTNPNVLEENEVRRLTGARLKDGFREGVVSGEEETIQEAFDTGYEAGYGMSYNVARPHGILWAIEHFSTFAEEPDSEQEVPAVDIHEDKLKKIIEEFSVIIRRTPLRSLFSVEELHSQQQQENCSIIELIEKHKETLLGCRQELEEKFLKAGLSLDLVKQVLASLEI